MNTASNLLYNFHQFISGVLCAALVVTLLGLAPGSALKPNEKVISVLMVLFFAGTTALTWYLRQQGRHGIVVAILSVIWMLVLAGIVYAAGKARWN
jgi:hypothetical protein